MLASIIRKLTKGPVYGFHVLHSEDGVELAFPFPQFEDHQWFARTEDIDFQAYSRVEAPPPLQLMHGSPTPGGGLLPRDLLEHLAAEPEATLFLSAFLSPRLCGKLQTGDGALRGDAALLYKALEEIPVGQKLIALAPASLLFAKSHAPLRSHIAQRHGIHWLLFTGSHLMDRLPMATVLISLQAHSGPSTVTRLVNLAEADTADLDRLVEAAAKREGGEGEHCVVLRKTMLGSELWSYHIHTRAFAAEQADTAALGDPVPLGELVERIFVAPPSRAQARMDVDVPEDLDSLPPEMSALVTARDIQNETLLIPGRRMVSAADMPEHARLQPGDLVFRSIITRDTLHLAAVPNGISAYLGNGVIGLRWKDDIPLAYRELIIWWLQSPRSLRWLELNGAFLGSHLRLAASQLRELPVPPPTSPAMASLTSLRELESWYRERADAVRDVRQEVFSATRLADAVPLVLATHQAEKERIQAASDSQGNDYRIRNYFPHPIAIRRERLLVLTDARERQKETLELTELLVSFLALLGLAQQKHMSANALLGSKHLAATLKGETVKLSWGLAWAVLHDSLTQAATHRDVLQLPFPQLALLGAKLDKIADSEQELRHQRNKEAHLQRLSSIEARELGRELETHLEFLLDVSSFLADLPLVHVRDYSLSPLTGERIAEFEYLQGSSTVFRRERQAVKQELARGATGVLDQFGGFHDLSPWLLLEVCETCHRPEMFLFSSFDDDTATYVAMESGHPAQNEAFKLFRSAFLKSHN